MRDGKKIGLPSGRVSRSDESHTPGPWRIFQTTGAPPFYIIGIGRETGEGITDGNTGLGVWGADSPEARANARLIAAAPDLLAALKEVTDAYVAMHGGEETFIAERARVAIAKATAPVDAAEEQLLAQRATTNPTTES